MEYISVNDLAPLFAQFGSGPLLAFTRTLIALAKPDGTLLEWNPAFSQLAPATQAPLALQDVLFTPSQPLFGELLRATLRKQETSRGTLELLAGPERQERLVYDCLLVPLPDGNFLFLADPVFDTRSDELEKLTRDLQESRRALDIKQTGLEAVLAQVDEIAHTDQLTFLANQRKIVGELQRKVTQSSRSKKPLIIFMLDVDRFKTINDTYGHLVGDQVLRTLSGKLRLSMRQSDSIGRYGGEEFLILLPGTPLEAALGMAERLIRMARALVIEVDGRVVRLTVSIGIAEYQRGETWKKFLERADLAMYHSKNNGRDQWSLSRPDAPAGKTTRRRKK